MPSKSQSLLNYLREVVGAWRDEPRDDATLLARFVESDDEAAFRALIWRHGPQVWRICQCILGDTPDAEDAFQTTFLILARKAGGLRREPLAGWLHRVARRTALNADAGLRRRRSLEKRLRAVPQPVLEDSPGRTELYAVLDEELASLPEQLRIPLVLRYLEGETLESVAQLVGCSRRVLGKRLARGETILRERLERRGLVLSTVTALLASSVAISAVPAGLIGKTARAAVAFRIGTLTGEAVEAARAGLGAFPAPLERTLLWKSLWIVLACCLGLGGTAVVACRALGVRQDEADAAGSVSARSEERPGPGGQGTVRIDRYGDPLPDGALARLGTGRLRHLGPIHSVVFSLDGKIVASGGADDTVRLWDAATGKEIRTLREHIGGCPTVTFSPDGKTVASGGCKATVRLWEVATGKEIRTLRGEGHEEGYVPSVALALSSDGKTVALGRKDGPNGPVCLWGVSTGKKIRIREYHKGTVYSVSFSPDSKTVALGWEDGAIRLWESATSKEIRTLRGHQGPVLSVIFSPDGQTLASGSGDGSVRLWEAATGKEIRTLKGHQGHVVSVAFSSDGQTVHSGGEDGTSRLWEAATGKEVRTLRSHKGHDVRPAAFSPDGKIMASVGRQDWTDITIRLWEMTTGKEIRTLPRHRSGVSSIAFSSDGKVVASGSWDSTVRLWEAATGKELRILRGHQGFVRALALSSDGKTLASGGDNDSVRLWEAATGKEIRNLQGDKGSVRSLAFSPDSKTLASGGDDGVVRLWEVATGKEIRTLEYEEGVLSVAFSPDGKTMAAGGFGGKNGARNYRVCLWDVATGKEIQILRHKHLVGSLAFSSDGKVVVSGGGSGGGIVHLWEVATGKEIRTLGHKDGCFSLVALSPDGKTVAAVSSDDTVRLWEVTTGKEIRTLLGHQGPVWSMAFAPDGRTLATGSRDTTGLIWDVASLTTLKPMTVSPLPPPELEIAWAELADAEPARAYPTLWKLTGSPAQAIALLQARLRPVAPLANLQQLKRWIADLDDNRFPAREKAQRQIEKLGDAAVPALRQALKGRPALEARRRLENLLAKLEPKGVIDSPRLLRELRAVQTLESIGTTGARRVLQTLAKGVSEARLTVEAQAALDRLAKRSAAAPKSFVP